MKSTLALIMILITVASLLPDTAMACPNCKEAYASDGVTSVASGYGASILFMMAMPFVVIGGFVLRLWLARRNADQSAMRS
jgi:hypothetical protein